MHTASTHTIDDLESKILELRTAVSRCLECGIITEDQAASIRHCINNTSDFLDLYTVAEDVAKADFLAAASQEHCLNAAALLAKHIAS